MAVAMATVTSCSNFSAMFFKLLLFVEGNILYLPVYECFMAMILAIDMSTCSQIYNTQIWQQSRKYSRKNNSNWTICYELFWSKLSASAWNLPKFSRLGSFCYVRNNGQWFDNIIMRQTCYHYNQTNVRIRWDTCDSRKCSTEIISNPCRPYIHIYLFYYFPIESAAIHIQSTFKSVNYSSSQRTYALETCNSAISILYAQTTIFGH